jgi:hypothetical protein
MFRLVDSPLLAGTCSFGLRKLPKITSYRTRQYSSCIRTISELYSLAFVF